MDEQTPLIYEICLKGQLDPGWSDWFGGLAITSDDPDCIKLTGPVVDQAALHGLLKKVRDIGLPLHAVNCLGPAAR